MPPLHCGSHLSIIQGREKEVFEEQPGSVEELRVNDWDHNFLGNTRVTPFSPVRFKVEKKPFNTKVDILVCWQTQSEEKNSVLTPR